MQNMLSKYSKYRCTEPVIKVQYSTGTQNRLSLTWLGPPHGTGSLCLGPRPCPASLGSRGLEYFWMDQCLIFLKFHCTWLSDVRPLTFSTQKFNYLRLHSFIETCHSTLVTYRIFSALQLNSLLLMLQVCWKYVIDSTWKSKTHQDHEGKVT